MFFLGAAKAGYCAMSIMQSLFGGGSEELVGLDISSSAVKLLELSRRGDRFHVETFAVEMQMFCWRLAARSRLKVAALQRKWQV